MGVTRSNWDFKTSRNLPPVGGSFALCVDGIFPACRSERGLLLRRQHAAEPHDHPPLPGQFTFAPHLGLGNS